MKRRVVRVLFAIFAVAGLGLVPAPVFEWLPRGELTDAISGVAVAEAQYGTSRRVARRTSRRTSARHNAYYDSVEAVPAPSAASVTTTSLPAGCTSVNRGGVAYQQCGGTLYRPYYQGDQLVFVPE